MVGSPPSHVAAIVAAELSQVRQIAQVVEDANPGGDLSNIIAPVLNAWVGAAEQILNPQAVAA